jgi:transcriptional regulator with XRE-family HTH domain
MVGENIKSLRAAAGISQRELADRVGISPSMLSLVEAGRREPSVKLLRDISRALQVPSATLFAFALEDESESHDDLPLFGKLREMNERLLAAVHHSLVLQRLRRAREQD